MRRRNREITVFNLSMLDVICGALGAFLILVIMLLPYYKKDLAQENQRLARELEELKSETPLIIIIEWEAARVDVDLHVVDPAGAEFFFQRKRIAGRPGRLSEDDTVGPGFEVWEIAMAEAGSYRLYYNLYARRGNPENPSVRGRVLHRGGVDHLPALTLSRTQVKVPVTTISVGADGDVRITAQNRS
jgi:hypothetical protein